VADSAYDELPYPSAPRPETHPDRLAAHALLAGLRPAPLERCRVLELGCADGGNLIPMALGLPGARFVGIDLGAAHIAAGRATAAALGLANVDLRELDLLRFDEAIGDAEPFDYIVAHGLYSWVPPAVREAILALCARRLAPHGVAYVSYNAMPGWRVRGLLRDELLARAPPELPTPARIAAARAWLDRCASWLPSLARGATADASWAALLGAEVERARRTTDTHLCHDYLAAENEALPFRTFHARAARHGLAFLAEADFAQSSLDALPEAAAAAIRADARGDLVATEEGIDLVRARAFRQTLLCRAERDVDRAPGPERMRELLIASWVEALPGESGPLATEASADASRARAAKAEPDGAAAPPGDDDDGDDGDGAPLTSGFAGFGAPSGPPVVGAALRALARRYPRAARFDELLALSPRRGSEDAATLAAALLRGAARGLVELHAHEPRVATVAGERPLASTLARLQAGSGAPTATNLRHAPVKLDAQARALIAALDGTADRAEIARRTGLAGERLEGALAGLTRAGLLVA
jgi:SAM-dependent methyltransferase